MENFEGKCKLNERGRNSKHEGYNLNAMWDRAVANSCGLLAIKKDHKKGREMGPRSRELLACRVSIG